MSKQFDKTSCLPHHAVRQAVSILLLGGMGLAGLESGARESPNDPCANALADVRAARSDDELQRRLERAGRDGGLTPHCTVEIEREPAVMQLRQRQYQQLTTRARDEAQQLRARHALSAERLQQNQVVLDARRQAADARRQPQQSRPRIPAPSTPDHGQTPTPTFAGVLPETIVPGTEILVFGDEFGASPGSVRIRVHGQPLDAAVLHWEQDMVIAYLAEDTDGLTLDPYASVELARADGSSATMSVPFYPLYEAAVFVTALHAELPFSAGAMTEEIVFMGESLTEHWKVQAVHVDGVVGQCEPLPPPAASFGGTTLATRLRLTSPSSNPGLCMLSITAVGPKGVSHGISAESALP